MLNLCGLRQREYEADMFSAGSAVLGPVCPFWGKHLEQTGSGACRRQRYSDAVVNTWRLLSWRHKIRQLWLWDRTVQEGWFLITTNVKQEAQLPQRNSASAAHMEGGGLGPPAHSPFAPSGYTYPYGRIRKPQRTYTCTSSVASVKRT